MLGMRERSHFKALGWADPSVIAMTDRGIPPWVRFGATLKGITVPYYVFYEGGMPYPWMVCHANGHVSTVGPEGTVILQEGGDYVVIHDPFTAWETVKQAKEKA